MNQMKNDAVSPVIGVLLMLVVTIIIAAIVSSFAGGMASDQSKAPQAAISAISDIIDISDENNENYVPDYPDDYTANNGILFENKGGDGFSVDDIAIQVQSDDTKTVISNSYEIPADTCLDTDVVTAYIMKVGATDATDKYIKNGDKFKLYADNCYDASAESLGEYAMAPCITWKPEGAIAGFAAFTGHKVDYKIIDKSSQKVISQGQLTLTL